MSQGLDEEIASIFQFFKDEVGIKHFVFNDFTFASPCKPDGRLTIEPRFASDSLIMKLENEHDVSEPRDWCYMNLEATEDRKVSERLLQPLASGSAVSCFYEDISLVSIVVTGITTWTMQILRHAGQRRAEQTLQDNEIQHADDSQATYHIGLNKCLMAVHDGSFADSTVTESGIITLHGKTTALTCLSSACIVPTYKKRV